MDTVQTSLTGRAVVLMAVPLALAAWLLMDFALVPAAIAMAPIVLLVALRMPALMCALFVAFSFFRLHDAYPALAPLRIPQAMSILMMISIGWNLALSRSIKIYWTREFTLLLVFAGLCTMGIAFAINRPLAFQFWTELYLKVVLMTYVLAWLIRSPKDMELLVRVFLITSALVALKVIMNHITGTDLVEGTRVTIGGKAEFGAVKTSVLGDPNDLALILLFPLGFALTTTIFRPTQFDRLLGGLTSAMLVWAILATQSRGGLMGLGAVFAVIGLSLVRNKGRFIALLLVGAVVVYFATGLGSREQAITFGDLDDSAQGRLDAWRAAVKMALDHPLTGVGMGNFEDNYYFFTDHWVGINHAVHSTWFGVLAEVGITGFIVYVLMVYMVYRRAYRQNLAAGAENWDPMMRAVAMGLLAGLAGYCVSATFLSQMYTWPMHIILALTIAAGQIAANWDLSREKAEAPREYKPQVWI